MALEFTICPVCKQRLAIINYVTVGTEVVCANCETNLRLTGRQPLRVERLPIEATFNVNSRPESYG